MTSSIRGVLSIVARPGSPACDDPIPPEVLAGMVAYVDKTMRDADPGPGYPELRRMTTAAK
jgi:hypothetical protein